MNKVNSSIQSSAYVRNFVFGVEDSLVSTVGLLSGIAITGVSHKTIFITGTVLIFVEAFSMAAGSLLSEHSAEVFAKKREVSFRGPSRDGVIMFFSYFISGFIPLFPYIILKTSSALTLSIGCSLVALFILGIISGKISRVHPIRSAFEMVVIGGIAIIVGILVGNFAKNILT